MTDTAATTQAALIYRLSPGEWEATFKRIAKLNLRAAKRGFTGRIDASGVRKEREVINELGFTVTEAIYEVTITGEPACYEGWTFLAELDWDEHAGLITRCAPGVEGIDRSRLREGACDHCNTVRRRAKIYLVGDETGRQVQVGSTCIKDFLGWEAPARVHLRGEDRRGDGAGARRRGR